jgi:iron complex transport system substrate-binding protein
VKNYTLLVLALIAISCSPAEKPTDHQLQEVQYAEAFHFEVHDDGRYLVVKKPWPNAQVAKSYKLDKTYKRIVCTSTSHLPYFELLGKGETVIGFPNLKYISSSYFTDRGLNGHITDIGADGNINLELLIGLQPDAVIAFDMGGESAILDKITEAGIPVFYNADFLETTPLGRAEWIKFFGALLNEEDKADSIFNSISSAYNSLVEKTKAIEKRPKVLNGVLYGDIWFMPGGENWASILYKDAGAEYLWANDTTSGWLELSFEAVFDRSQNADFWIGTASFDSKSALLSANPRYGEFAPFEADRVFNYSKKKGPNGGYDYLESATARPDLVLSDLIKIIHPQLLPYYETVYFEQLK